MELLPQNEIEYINNLHKNMLETVTRHNIEHLGKVVSYYISVSRNKYEVECFNFLLEDLRDLFIKTLK